jgi:hypothetical protein
MGGRRDARCRDRALLRAPHPKRKENPRREVVAGGEMVAGQKVTRDEKGEVGLV